MRRLWARDPSSYRPSIDILRHCASYHQPRKRTNRSRAKRACIIAALVALSNRSCCLMPERSSGKNPTAKSTASAHNAGVFGPWAVREDFHTSNRTSHSPLTALVTIGGGACFGLPWLKGKCSQDTIAAHRSLQEASARLARPLRFARSSQCRRNSAK